MIRRGGGLDGLLFSFNSCHNTAEDRSMPVKTTHHGRPYTGDRHAGLAFALPIHRETLGEDRHAHLPHCVRRLASEEPGVDGRADDNDATAPSIPCKVRECGLHGCVQSLDVDPLHELEPLQRRPLDGGPPDRPGIVDDDVQAAEGLDGALYQRVDAVGVARVHLQRQGFAAGQLDLLLHRQDRGLTRIWIRREGRAWLGRAVRLGRDDNWHRVQLIRTGNPGALSRLGLDRLRLTSVAIACQMDRNLATDPSRCADYESDWFVIIHPGSVAVGSGSCTKEK